MVACQAALIAATTWAVSRHSLQPSGPEVCGAAGIMASCAQLNPLVLPRHFIAPISCATAFLVVAVFPTLVLSSRNRHAELWAAALAMLGSLLAVLAGAWAFLHLSSAWAYALSLHYSASLLTARSPPSSLLSVPVYRSMQAAALFSLVVGAAYAGPPLPVWDAPGMPGSCGAVAHMAAWLFTGSLGRAAQCAGEWCRELTLR